MIFSQDKPAGTKILILADINEDRLKSLSSDRNTPGGAFF